MKGPPEIRDTKAATTGTAAPDDGRSRRGPLLAYLAALAGHWFARTATGRRRWTVSLVAGIVLIGAFGTVLAVTHHHVAVS